MQFGCGWVEKLIQGMRLDGLNQTQRWYLRTMLGDTKQVYDWNYDLMKGFNFKGGLTSGLNDLF